MGIYEELSQSLLGDIEYASAVCKDPLKQFALQRLKSRYRKRFRNGESTLATKAIESFKEINSLVSTKVVITDPFILHNASVFIHNAFERFNKRNDEELIQVPFDISHIVTQWRFGPGASNGVQGTHTAEKLSQPMSCTAAAESLVRSLRDTNIYLRSYDAKKCMPVSVVSGSRLTTVRKNEEVDRTIAIEPSGNTALQLAAGMYIEDVLRSIGLDIRTQEEKNKIFSKLGSIYGDLVTLDMKSASDLILIDLCRKLLPRQLVLFLLRIRSSETELPDKSVVKLNMMSTMGNGFTFPLMTLLFVALLYAVRLRRGGPVNYINWKDCGVFGDDIVCTKDEASDLIKVIEDSGFIINRDKSCLEGDFRESCGGDYFKGYDVTPFYIKSLRNDAEVYVAINQVLDYCGKHEFIFDRTLATLKQLIKSPLHFVPEWHGDTDGVRCRSVQRRYKHLAVKQKKVKLREEHFSMMLAVGGYLNAGSPGLTYTPRPRKTRYVVRRSRLPNGYLDGRHVGERFDQDGRPAARRDARASLFIDSWIFLLSS